MTTAGVLMVIPKGRTAAEKRLSAIAALHSPVSREPVDVHGVRIADHRLICPECSRNSRRGDEEVPWPCATARLLGPWPGEVIE